MKSIRNFAYATVLTLSTLNFAPSLASAQDAAGSFTLTTKCTGKTRLCLREPTDSQFNRMDPRQCSRCAT